MRLFGICYGPFVYSVVGGLTPNVTEAELKGRFSAIKNLTVKSVEIILREDGVCKGFAYNWTFFLID